MSDRLIPAEQVWSALSDALAIAREFDGEPMATKLEAMGLSPQIVAEVVSERWETYKPPLATDQDCQLFARAFAEGLLTGRMLRPESRV